MREPERPKQEYRPLGEQAHPSALIMLGIFNLVECPVIGSVEGPT